MDIPALSRHGGGLRFSRAWVVVLSLASGCGTDPASDPPVAATVAEVQPPRMPFDHDPAAPDLACDTSCHTAPRTQKHDKHIAAECTQCHLSEEEVAKLPKIQPYTPGPRRRIEGVLVPDQLEARRRLKGKPMPSLPARPAPSGMAFIPAGPFIMGSNIRWDDEGPEHVVDLHAYFIDRFEVTTADYRAFVRTTGHRPPGYKPGTPYPEDFERHPITWVDFDDAQAYCRWVGKRLPSEEEWEKAARGTDGRQYPWGEVFDRTYTNNPQVESTGTRAVGSYEQGRSPYGLYDMSGNVWEWVDAWYEPHPGNEVPNEEYGRRNRISKGGSWFSCLHYNCGISAPAYNRAFLSPPTRNGSLGFRCVKDLPDVER